MKFKDSFWSQCLAVFVLILFLPLVIIAIPIIVITQEFECIGERRRYRKSNYCLNLGVRYRAGITNTPAYRFYEAALSRGLSVEFHHLAEFVIDYCIHEGTVYILPDFDSFYMDESDQWVTDRDGDLRTIEEEMSLISSSVQSWAAMPVKILLERKMIPIEDLHGVCLPKQICLVQTYETTFCDEVIAMKQPDNGLDLYSLMRATKDLCGNYELIGETIFWDLYDGFNLHVDASDGYVSIHDKTRQITHWHPEPEDIYNEVCKIGKRGNVMVIHVFCGFGGVCYMGPKENCPYKKQESNRFGTYFYLEAE